MDKGKRTMRGINHYSNSPDNWLVAPPNDDYKEGAAHYRKTPPLVNPGHNKESVETVDHAGKKYPAIDVSPLWGIQFYNIPSELLEETLADIRRWTLEDTLEDMARIFGEGRYRTWYAMNDKSPALLIDGLPEWKRWSGKHIVLWKKLEKQTAETLAYTLGHIREIIEANVGYPPEWDNV